MGKKVEAVCPYLSKLLTAAGAKQLCNTEGYLFPVSGAREQQQGSSKRLSFLRLMHEMGFTSAFKRLRGHLGRKILPIDLLMSLDYTNP